MKTPLTGAVTWLVASTLLGGSALSAAQPEARILRLDSDGDGLVSREEFRLPEGHGVPRMLERADGDRDGVVSRDELAAAIDRAAEEKQARMRERMLSRFDESDADGNGFVDRQELLDHAFTELDANGDGYLDAEEARARHDRRPRREGRRQDRG